MCDPRAIWSLVPLPFLNSACTYGSSQFKNCWSLVWGILNITLLACEMSTIEWYFLHSLALPFFGIEVKADLFLSRGLCWVFQICWHIEYSTLRVLSFRILNSSAGIPLSPLALFIVMFPKAHLTSHSGSRWVITPSWLITYGCATIKGFVQFFYIFLTPCLNFFCFC